jgi:hypothetical protein
MSVFAALGMTQRALARNRAFDGDEGENIVFPQWRDFSIALLKWAKSRIPKQSLPMFQEKKTHLLSILEANSTQPGELRKWSYWGERFVPIHQSVQGTATE